MYSTARLTKWDGRLPPLVKLATRLIVEEALEAENRDALGRDYYEHGASPGQGLAQRRAHGSPEDGGRAGGLCGTADCRSRGAVPLGDTRDPVWSHPKA